MSKPSPAVTLRNPIAAMFQKKNKATDANGAKQYPNIKKKVEDDHSGTDTKCRKLKKCISRGDLRAKKVNSSNDNKRTKIKKGEGDSSTTISDSDNVAVSSTSLTSPLKKKIDGIKSGKQFTLVLFEDVSMRISIHS